MCAALLATAGQVDAAAPVLRARLEGRLGNQDMMIAVEAGTTAPRLRSLALRGRSAWTNGAVETLPAQMLVRGTMRAIVWHLDRKATHFGDDAIDLVYLADSPRLELIWRWRARAKHGPLEHDMVLRNLGRETIALPLPASFKFDWEIPPHAELERFSVEKGADVPSAEGTHREPVLANSTWEGRSSTYARPRADQPREIIPYLLVEPPADAGLGWYVGIESSARTRITLTRDGPSLRGEAGLDVSARAEPTQVPVRGSFVTPTVFLGASTGGPDGAGNVLKRWVRAVLGNRRTLGSSQYPMLVGNSWGSGLAVDESLAQRMIVDSADLGLELFHLDAGWFRDVGDWRAEPHKFPHGIRALADLAHRHGIKFGLWMAWAEAGSSTRPGALSVLDPVTKAWLIADPPAGWTHDEPYKGITLDLGVPKAQAWVARELERVVDHYHLDMLEHDGYLVAQGSSHADHPGSAPDPASLKVYADSGFLWADGTNATDVSYRATLAYYALHQQLRTRHPALLLEVCNDGGRMIDFGSAAHGDYFSITDSYDPLSNRRAFFDASYVLPGAMLEAYVGRWPTPLIENFRYQLRSGMLGWFSLMLDSREWNSAQHAEARREFALYKSALRPLIRDADLYHVSARPDGIHWDGLEYFSTLRRRGVLFAFRGTAEEPVHRFPLQGLDPNKRYRLRYQDGVGAGNALTGRELMHSGAEVTLPVPLSSELVFFEEIS